jgi:hypothetical protein
MTYNERYQVRRLSPEGRRRHVENAVRRKSARPQYTRPQVTQDIADDLNLGDDEEWEVNSGPLAAITKRYDMYAGVPRATRVDHYPKDPYFTQAAPRKRLQVHWFVYAGIALCLVLIGLLASGPIATAWQIHTDDVTYGMPRTYQTDAVVGHSDSNSNPSHFIAENLRGRIIVVELPGGDLSKARDYFITSEANGDASVPVKLNFQDINGDGKLDIIVQVGDPGNIVTFTFYNDGTQFTSKP